MALTVSGTGITTLAVLPHACMPLIWPDWTLPKSDIHNTTHSSTANVLLPQSLNGAHQLLPNEGQACLKAKHDMCGKLSLFGRPE